jgi:hypothetical protein
MLFAIDLGLALSSIRMTIDKVIEFCELLNPVSDRVQSVCVSLGQNWSFCLFKSNM